MLLVVVCVKGLQCLLGSPWEDDNGVRRTAGSPGLSSQVPRQAQQVMQLPLLEELGCLKCSGVTSMVGNYIMMMNHFNSVVRKPAAAASKMSGQIKRRCLGSCIDLSVWISWVWGHWAVNGGRDLGH